MQGQEPVGGKEALPADSPGQGLVIRFQALIEHGSKVSVCTWEALPVSREMGRKAENQVPKTHGVSCNPETLQFTKRTDPGTEKALVYSFIQQECI